MFLNNHKTILSAILGLLIFPQLGRADAPIAIAEFVVPGPYKLISGPRDICDKLAIDKDDLKHPFVIGAQYTFSLKNDYLTFPSEDNKNCNMNRRDTVNVTSANTVVLTYDREEVCPNKSQTKQRIEAHLTKGEIKIINTEAGEKPSICVWKSRPEAAPEKK